MKEFQTLKTDLTKTRIITNDVEEVSLDRGEIAVRIEKFSFTSNNITYGAAGEAIGYWNFFPPSEDQKNEWGCIPMWGFAEITTSGNNELKVGERIFGYFPPGNFLTLSPIKVSNQSFFDGKDHRKELPAVYNNYLRLSGEEGYDKSMDNIRALLFPLHITAFCLCDSLEEDSYLGASQVIIISASSKTGIGLAQGLVEKDRTPKIVGLTSKNNVDFVLSLGCYEEVISYDDLDKIDRNLGSVMVDMAGNQAVLEALHKSLGPNILKCLTVGMTHWNSGVTVDDALAQAALQSKTEFFFAPSHIQKRVSDWGQEEFNEKTSVFMDRRAIESQSWMQIKEISGLEEFLDTYNEVVRGNINPNEGIIVLP